ncbi:NfeD family protein [Lyngbya confervoides]|uniref:NfeD-like C-terminal domain-containing protein n=1 Tax=Lyngbya confervoides BDU141951 TaxID=1574623 RepID=A0ABD4T1L9_9CYAN|nr:NfeD family protein [Lyngbya confervoides]MCM1982539.1 hypothetical protein [Lyngbya confervoides BDU141951]
MQPIYWICFTVGGIFVLLAAIGGIDGAEIDGADVGLWGEPEFDSTGIDADAELVDPQNQRSDRLIPSRRQRWRFNPLLLLRTIKFWTFGCCFFGLTGLLFTAFQPQLGARVILIIALLMGLLVGSMIAIALEVLRQRNPDGFLQPEDLIGQVGTVELPIDMDHRGKIRIQINDGSREMIARTSDTRSLSVGESVVVVGIESNQLWVVSEDSLRSPD